MKRAANGSSILVNGPDAKSGAMFAAVIAALLLSAAAAVASGANLTVENPWMRFVMEARPAAGYFTLNNNTGSAVELTGASSSACGMLMLHQSKNVNGVERMLPVKSLTVPAHGRLSFAPGGYHLMCMSPNGDLTVGASVPITLEFADGETITAQFSVKGANEQ